MKKIILALVVSCSSAAFACPNLEGSFNFSSSSTIDVVQHEDEQGVMTYKITVDDHNCAVCKFDQFFKADGETVVREFPITSRKESTTISCENNRLKFRQTTDTFNERGEKITSYSENYDYRINADSALVVETIKEGVPYSKTVHPRIN
jgi:hypothetical protein